MGLTAEQVTTLLADSSGDGYTPEKWRVLLSD